MRRSAVNARNAGFALIGRINRWLIAGAVVLSGGISLAAARSFHGHTTAGTSSAASSASSSGSGSSADSGGGLQQPSQAPAAAQPVPAPVVSGGS